MFDKLIENAPKLMRALTFKRTAYVCVLATVALILFTFYDSRATVIEWVKATSIGRPYKNVIIGDEATVKSVKSIVDRSPLISGIQLVNTDFRSNTRTTAFFYSDRRDLQILIDSAVYNRVWPSALFMGTTSGTPEQREFASASNSRMINIIGAEFVCYPSKDSTLARMAPEFPAIAPVLCSMSIPPYAGKFAGYLNLFLTRTPSDDEKDLLRDAARALASDIFDREVSR